MLAEYHIPLLLTLNKVSTILLLGDYKQLPCFSGFREELKSNELLHHSRCGAGLKVAEVMRCRRGGAGTKVTEVMRCCRSVGDHGNQAELVHPKQMNEYGEELKEPLHYRDCADDGDAWHFPSAAIGGAVMHGLVCMNFWVLSHLYTFECPVGAQKPSTCCAAPGPSHLLKQL